MIGGPATRPGTVQGAWPRTPSAPRSAPDSPADVAWCAMNEDHGVPRRLLVDAPATRASARTVAIIDEAPRVTGTILDLLTAAVNSFTLSGPLSPKR
jgi:hypothetical protein